MFLFYCFVDWIDFDVLCYLLCEDEGNVFFLDIIKNY